jgi:hypothetical protein
MRIRTSVLLAITLVGTLMTTPAFSQPRLPCIQASWTPEVFTFYGNTVKVAEKLEKVQANLLDRRVYLLISETPGRTEAALFERKDGQNVSLSRWATDSNIKLAAMLNDKLLTNHGNSCAGELAKSVLKTLGADVNRGDTIPAPTTALAAYNEALQQPVTDYVRVSLFFLC